jgi:hypothetical protein
MMIGNKENVLLFRGDKCRSHSFFDFRNHVCFSLLMRVRRVAYRQELKPVQR